MKALEKRTFEEMAYHSEKLIKGEALAMLELEKQLGKKIPLQKSFLWGNFGYTLSDRHVTRLSLWKHPLDSLPRHLCKLVGLEGVPHQQEQDPDRGGIF